MTTEQEHAAALADKIDRLLPLAQFDRVTLNSPDAGLVAKALRAYAKPTPADADVREIATQAMRATCGCISHRGCENEAEPGGCACRNDADAVLSALRVAGFVVTPEEPNMWMCAAGEDSHCLISYGMAHDCYRAMLAAAKESHRE